MTSRIAVPDDHWGDWEPTDELADPAEDPQPWAHPWAAWLSNSMSVAINPSSQMTWSELGRWTVSCRWGIKSHPESILPALLWLGPHLERNEDVSSLLGYMHFECDDRPVLVWLDPDGSLRGEGLNAGRRNY
jgi:hypothetical protein